MVYVVVELCGCTTAQASFNSLGNWAIYRGFAAVDCALFLRALAISRQGSLSPIIVALTCAQIIETQREDLLYIYVSRQESCLIISCVSSSSIAKGGGGFYNSHYIRIRTLSWFSAKIIYFSLKKIKRLENKYYIFFDGIKNFDPLFLKPGELLSRRVATRRSELLTEKHTCTSPCIDLKHITRVFIIIIVVHVKTNWN